MKTVFASEFDSFSLLRDAVYEYAATLQREFIVLIIVRMAAVECKMPSLDMPLAKRSKSMAHADI